jgi:hypothetical protein
MQGVPHDRSNRRGELSWAAAVGRWSSVGYSLDARPS